MCSNGNTYEDDHIRISENEDSDFMEFPKEEDGTVLLSTIQAQFPDAIGIKYKGSSGAWRVIREVDNTLAAPKGGWGDRVYYLTVTDTKKRKVESVDNDRSPKYAKTSVNPLLKDMAVIGLPFKTTNEELKEYFEKNYGELVYSEVKYDRTTGKSRGFGFIRFKEEENASEALKGEHYMMGRKVEVRQKKDKPMKMFVGRLPNGTTQEDLNKYFSQFGELTDTYIPTPFRNFAFLTYASTEDGRACLRENHVLDGVRLNVMERNVEKDRLPRNDDQRGYGNKPNSSFSGGYTKHNQRDSHQNYNQMKTMLPQQTSQDHMASDLKNMLFQFLTSKN